MRHTASRLLSRPGPGSPAALLVAALLAAPLPAQPVDPNSSRVIRAGDVLSGLVVEERETDPDLIQFDKAEDADENRRAANRPPRLLKTQPTAYPDTLRGSGVVGEVMVSLIVDRLGRASHVRVEQSPDELFSASALDALTGWEFLPALKGGRTTNSRVRVNIVVAEEVGDTTFFDFAGGRISLEGVTYAGAQEHPIRRLFGLRPIFPFELLVDAKPGEVMIEYSVGEDGIPYDVTILEATHPEFALATRAAMGHWRFSPALNNGVAVPARLRYRVSFQPDEVPEDVLALARRLKAGDLTGFTDAKETSRAPRILRSIEPMFAHGEGRKEERDRVYVRAVITENGEVLLPRIEASEDALRGYAAATSLAYWRFSPAQQRGRPVRVDHSTPVIF